MTLFSCPEGVTASKEDCIGNLHKVSVSNSFVVASLSVLRTILSKCWYPRLEMIVGSKKVIDVLLGHVSELLKSDPPLVQVNQPILPEADIREVDGYQWQ